MTGAETLDDADGHLIDAIRIASADPRFAHHLAKAAVERWFAFELAAALDDALRPRGWLTVVERGGGGDLGNIDLLLVPRSYVVLDKSWPTAQLGADWHVSAVAVELKHCRLSDGDKPYADCLVDDLTRKPKTAIVAGRPIKHWFGILITTDGAWGARNGQTETRRARMSTGDLPLNAALKSLHRQRMHDLRYEDWSSSAWIELIAAK